LHAERDGAILGFEARFAPFLLAQGTIVDVEMYAKIA
jgi:hypothetical protein